MGEGFSLHCKNCDFQRSVYLGIGFAYPRIYKETVEEIKQGEFGEKLSAYFREHADAAVDPTIVLLSCPRCGKFTTDKKMAVFLPVPGYDHSKRQRIAWCSAMPCYDIDYVSPSELEDHYRQTEAYHHRCEKCGVPMEILSKEQLKRATLSCPKCRGSIIIDQNIMWD